MDEVMEILLAVKPEVDFANEKKLIDDGLLDSFDIVRIVGELNDVFDIEIDVDDLLPENFNSAAAIFELVENLQADI